MAVAPLPFSRFKTDLSRVVVNGAGRAAHVLLLHAQLEQLGGPMLTAKLLKQVMDGDYHVSPRAQEVRQRWGMGERAQTRLSSKCPELGDLLLKLKAAGR